MKFTQTRNNPRGKKYKRARGPVQGKHTSAGNSPLTHSAHNYKGVLSLSADCVAGLTGCHNGERNKRAPGSLSRQPWLPEASRLVYSLLSLRSSHFFGFSGNIFQQPLSAQLHPVSSRPSLLNTNLDMKSPPSYQNTLGISQWTKQTKLSPGRLTV